MNKYRKLEIAILSAKRERNLQKMEDIKKILDHNAKVLNMKIDKLMVGSKFEKTKPFKEASNEYSVISRLVKLTQYYVWS